MKEVTNTGEWEEYRTELHQIIDAAIERMKKNAGYQKDGHFLTFTEREEMADSLGKEISGYLLEKNLITDPELIKILESETQPCPKCQSISARVKDGKQEEEIMVKTRVGKVPFPAPVFRCSKCRRKFSPLETFIKSR